LISHTNSNFWKLYKKLPLNIRETAKKQYRLFASDPYHASLYFKRVHSTRPIYSARITRNYRAVGVLEENIIVWFWIGSHDDYDRLLR
jgi:hypothetical protein